MTVVTQEFVNLAKSVAKAKGYPDLPMVIVPHPFETLPHDQIRRLAEEKFNEIISKVQKPQRLHTVTPEATH